MRKFFPEAEAGKRMSSLKRVGLKGPKTTQDTMILASKNICFEEEEEEETWCFTTIQPLQLYQGDFEEDRYTKRCPAKRDEETASGLPGNQQWAETVPSFSVHIMSGTCQNVQ